jgi:hypothetical protein
MIGMGLPFATDGNREGMRDEHGEGSDALFTKFRTCYSVILIFENVEENGLFVISIRYRSVDQRRTAGRILF